MSVAEKMTAIADAIREKTGETGPLSLDAMAQKIRQMEAWLINTARGNPITLTDSLDMKLRGLKLFGRTTQNGTPTPEAPVPLVSAGDGGTLGVTAVGKNLCEIGSTTFMQVNSISLAHPIPPGEYMLSCEIDTTDTDASTNNISFMDKDNVRIVGLQAERVENAGRYATPITLNRECTMIHLYASKDNINSLNDTATFSDIQIELGSTATEYEPYKGQTVAISTPNGLPGIPVTSGGNYTDETGQQWVCDEVDFGRGVYVQRVLKKPITDYSNPITFYNWEQGFTEGSVVLPTSRVKTNIGLSSHFILSSSGASVRFALGNNSTNATAWFVISGTLTKAEWQAKMTELSPSVLVALETPIETALSAEELAAYAVLHTNYHNTTILNDGGAGMEVQYVADTKLYIDNKINAMAAAIVNA